MTTYSIIVAADQQGGIGKENRLPWRLKGDLANFKRLTTGKAVLMGRRTWQSLPKKPLPGRDNIVISSTISEQMPNTWFFATLAEAQEHCRRYDEVFVIGGATIYQRFFPLADRLYLTRVDGVYDTDTRLEGYDPSRWREIAREEHPAEGDAPGFAIVECLPRRAQGGETK